MKLSVVVPAFNESATIAEVIRQVDAVEIEKEIIVVDDGSTDGTPELVEALAKGRDDLLLVRMDRNRGKGAALREGFRVATGDVIVIQDADLEYDPADFPALLAVIDAGEADVVYGSRTRGDNPQRNPDTDSNSPTGIHFIDKLTVVHPLTGQAAIGNVERAHHLCISRAQ